MTYIGANTQREEGMLRPEAAAILPHGGPAMRNLASILLLASALWACSEKERPPDTSSTIEVTGTIVERLDEAPYSYLRLETRSGPTWVAVPVSSVEKGATITVTHGVALKDVEAALLGRVFPRVVFGTLKRE